MVNNSRPSGGVSFGRSVKGVRPRPPLEVALPLADTKRRDVLEAHLETPQKVQIAKNSR